MKILSHVKVRFVISALDSKAIDDLKNHFVSIPMNWGSPRPADQGGFVILVDFDLEREVSA